MTCSYDQNVKNLEGANKEELRATFVFLLGTNHEDPRVTILQAVTYTPADISS